VVPSRAALKLGAWPRVRRHVAAFDLLIEQDGAFQLASRIQDSNLTRPKARSGFRVPDCLIFLREHRLDAWSFKTFQRQRCGFISMTVISAGG
jgi:hypothetical protein